MSRKKDTSQFFTKRTKSRDLNNMIPGQIQINEGILWYWKNSEGKKFWDVLAFRPCLLSVFEEDKKYNVHLKIGKENLSSGEEITFPECIIFRGKTFLNIR